MANDAYLGIYELISKIPYYDVLTQFTGAIFLRILIFTFGILIYSIIIWKFYSSLAKRDLFSIRLHRYIGRFASLKKLGDILNAIAKYTIVFPVYTFFWFLLFSIFLLTLSRSLTIEEIFFVSITIISVIRAAAYYNENLAIDVAKIFPLALLGIFVVDPTFFSPELINQRLEEFVAFMPKTLKYLTFIIGIEWILRILFLIRLKVGAKVKQ